MHSATRIEIEDPRIFEAQVGDQYLCFSDNSTNKNDKWLFIEQSKKLNMRYVIENVKTGMVWQVIRGDYTLEKWQNRDEQLWTITPRNKSGYSITNVASGENVGCPLNDQIYGTWKFNTYTATRIEIENPRIFEAQVGNRYLCFYDNSSNKNDKWLFIEQSKKLNMRYIIENEKTGMVWQVISGNYTLEKWQNRDEQLWTITPRNNSGYSITNVASGENIGCPLNGKIYDIWKFNTRSATRIEIENPRIFEAQVGDKYLCFSDNSSNENDKWLFIEHMGHITNIPVDKNNQAGEILEEAEAVINGGKGDNRDSNLWILKPQNKSEDFIGNVGSGGLLIYVKNGTNHEIWELNTNSDIWIKINDTDAFLVNKDGKIMSIQYRQNNKINSSLWVEEEMEERCMKYNMIEPRSS
ncbi:uncharacterized protein LOC108906693 isoform X1 [Anoplophora glabripennis]|uniref:uncharacterized protein LOC108906693 isoform X1 n=1 Tax=Anoplophora glabripennis TaxID=217634 RepID=UPI000874124E|nr:uncharacterized protein LOC108906693 isoform X1 [Anoplophora glabripennis]